MIQIPQPKPVKPLRGSGPLERECGAPPKTTWYLIITARIAKSDPECIKYADYESPIVQWLIENDYATCSIHSKSRCLDFALTDAGLNYADFDLSDLGGAA